MSPLSILDYEKRRQAIEADIQALSPLPPGRVKLVAATKYLSPEDLPTVLAAGIICLGENRIQAALDKIDAVAAWPPEQRPRGLEWHLIGHLQSNKLNKIIGKFNLIHSIDSLELAQALGERSARQGIVQPILLQVNVSGEASKSGFSPEGLAQAMDPLLKCPGVKIEGLMTMAPLDASEEETQACFQGLADLRRTLEDRFQAPLPELSMGMSQDYGHALQSGATILRIGSQLFL